MKKKEYDVFGILLGLVIGGLLGFFISTRVDANTSKEVMGDVTIDDGFIYLLEVAKYDNPNGAAMCVENIDEKEKICLNILRGDYYYVYAGVYVDKEKAQEEVNAFIELGYKDAKVVKEYILDMTNSVSGYSSRYDFYNKAIDYYISSLNNNTYQLDDDFLESSINTPIINYLNSLSYITKESTKTIYQLYVYKELISSLE